MEGSVEELSKYRFETGIEAINDAKLMYENARYKNALNRAYYGIFHAIRAVNALDGFFFIASKEEAEKQIARAEEFILYIRGYLVSKGIIE